MKRIVVLLLALCMLFGLTACGKDPAPPLLLAVKIPTFWVSVPQFPGM